MVEDNTQYPVVDGRTITLMNDYGNLADGKTYVLDFSEINNGGLADEAISFIRNKYVNRSASVTYLRVLLPAVRRFDEYASQKGIGSFGEYTESVKEDYRNYLDGLTEDGKPTYSEKYRMYLSSVPQTIGNSL